MLSHPYCFMEYEDSSLPSMWAGYCGRPSNNWHIADRIVRFGVGRNVTFSTCIMEDGGIAAEDDRVRMRVEFDASVEDIGTVI